MLKRTTSIRILCATIALALQGCTASTEFHCAPPSARDATQRSLTILADDLSPVRDAFNAASERWRAVALVSPTCSECVYGAEAVEREITDRYPASRVTALIVWIPILPSDNESAARAAATIFPPAEADRVMQFYDSHQTLGWRYAQQTFAGFYERARRSLADDHWLAASLDDRIEQERPQWDLYMLYAPGIRWPQSSDVPPMPTHWIRHLGRSGQQGDLSGATSTYWQDSPDSGGGPREGSLFDAMREMAHRAVGQPPSAEFGG